MGNFKCFREIEVWSSIYISMELVFLLKHAADRDPEVPKVASGRIEIRRIEVQVVHTIVIVPRSRPIVAVATLINRRTTGEVACKGEGRTAGCIRSTHLCISIVARVAI